MKILYICTHNRCRSILSEAITNQFASAIIQAKSAGSQPSGEVHPLSVKYLQEQNIDTKGLYSQSWDEFEDFTPDVVITVCDSAAKEVCPVWFGKAIKVHWGLADPSKLDGSEEQKAVAFRQTIDIIKQRVSSLINISHYAGEPETLRTALANLGARE